MVKVPRQTRIVKRMLKKRNKKKKTKRLGDHVRPLSQAEQFANFLLSQKKDVPTNVLSKLPKRWFQSHGLRELERRKKVTKEERHKKQAKQFARQAKQFANGIAPFQPTCCPSCRSDGFSMFLKACVVCGKK